MSATSVTTEQARLRLTRSRARMSLALHRLHASAGPAAHDTPGAHNPSSWLDALRAEPATRVLLEALALWWAGQPWQHSATLLSGVVAQRLRPLAQRHPLGLVLGAAALGSALVLLKPWRWISVPALAAGLLPQLLIKAVAPLRTLPWAELLANWLQAAEPPATTPPPP